MPADTMRGLRSLFDGNDGFMSGHQLLILRKPNRKLPPWAATKEGIQKVLLAAFPHLETDETERDRAARWTRAIQLYFRAHKSCRETAHEMGKKPAAIRALIRRIKRVAAGRTARGRERVKFGPGRIVGSRNRPRDQRPETRSLQISQGQDKKRTPLTCAQRVARLRRRKFLAQLLKRMEMISSCPDFPDFPEAERVWLESNMKIVWLGKQTLDSGRDVSKISPSQDRALALKIDALYREYIHT